MSNQSEYKVPGNDKYETADRLRHIEYKRALEGNAEEVEDLQIKDVALKVKQDKLKNQHHDTIIQH